MADQKTSGSKAAWAFFGVSALLAISAITYRYVLTPGAPPRSAQTAGAPAQVAGPTRAQVDAAAAMSPQDRLAMIQGMIASAEAKLEEDPSNLERWAMVMRSHATLGDLEKAKATLEKAIAANPESEAALREQALAFGITQ
ncbi:MAG: tetratricopeptide repeat protein [Pseudomonadota bacterium]